MSAENTAEHKKAIKQRRLTNVRVDCDPPHSVTRWCRDDEHRARQLEDWVREFHEFIRDHRSQDPVHLSVVREYEDVCSECGDKWEPMQDDGVTYCAGCGTEISV